MPAILAVGTASLTFLGYPMSTRLCGSLTRTRASLSDRFWEPQIAVTRRHIGLRDPTPVIYRDGLRWNASPFRSYT